MTCMPEYELFSELDAILSDNSYESSMSPIYCNTDQFFNELDSLGNTPSQGSNNRKESPEGAGDDLSLIFHNSFKEESIPCVPLFNFDFDLSEYSNNCSVSPLILNENKNIVSSLNSASFNDNSKFGFNIRDDNFIENQDIQSIQLNSFKNNFDGFNDVNSVKESFVENLQEPVSLSKDSACLEENHRALLPVTIVVKKLESENMVAPLNIPLPKNKLIPISSGNIFNESGKVAKSVMTLPSNKDDKRRRSARLEGKDYNVSNKGEKRLAPQNLPFTSLKKKSNSSKRLKTKALKAYELQPLPDPVLEKCRRNAINAKKNRDIQKARMIKLKTELEEERKEKLKLARENQKLKLAKMELEEKLNYFINCFTNEVN